jgi:hypothetical protein
MGAAPVCLLSYPSGIWELGSMTEMRNYMIFYNIFKHIICSAVSQYLAVV